MGFESVFNDVMGPVMRGPSSSHTAGAWRIGCMVRSLLGDAPMSVRATFDPATQVPPPGHLGCPRRRTPPHIYSEAEITQLLRASLRLRR